MTCKIKVIKEVTDIFRKYRPKLGQVYEAELGGDVKNRSAEFCIIDVLDKRIALRKGEYEVIG